MKPGAASISYSLEFEEEQARIAAGLTMDEYDALPGTPMWIDPQTGGRSKCHIILFYRMSQRIPAVAQDAAIRKMERDAKMKRGRP